MYNEVQTIKTGDLLVKIRRDPTDEQRECFWGWFHQVRGSISVSQVEENAGANRGLLTNPSGNLRGAITQKILETIADGLDLDRLEVYQKYLACINYQPPGGKKLLRTEQVLEKVMEHLQHPQVIAEKTQPYYTGPEAKLVGLYERLRPERQAQLLQFAQFLTITQRYDLSGQMADLMAEATAGNLDQLLAQVVVALKNTPGDTADNS